MKTEPSSDSLEGFAPRARASSSRGGVPIAIPVEPAAAARAPPVAAAAVAAPADQMVTLRLMDLCVLLLS